MPREQLTTRAALWAMAAALERAARTGGKLASDYAMSIDEAGYILQEIIPWMHDYADAITPEQPVSRLSEEEN